MNYGGYTMSDFLPQDIPFACDLTAIPAGKREEHERNGRALFSTIQQLLELPDGYGLRLAKDTQTILQVAEFITLERLCCPFFTFALEVPSGGDSIWLKLTGREGIKDFIRAEIGVGQ
jgi:hypothetical protein